MLFSGTIDSNLKFGGEHITDADVKKAAAIAQATEFIDAKPQGYQSPIAQGGSNVSGGQKQRLSIARAIAKDVYKRQVYGRRAGSERPRRAGHHGHDRPC